MNAKERKIDYEAFWAIYCDAFPEDERRSRESQLRVMEDDRYLISEIESDGRLLGSIASR